LYSAWLFASLVNLLTVIEIAPGGSGLLLCWGMNAQPETLAALAQ